jgi:hypothetical protein
VKIFPFAQLVRHFDAPSPKLPSATSSITTVKVAPTFNWPLLCVCVCPLLLVCRPVASVTATATVPYRRRTRRWRSAQGKNQRSRSPNQCCRSPNPCRKGDGHTSSQMGCCYNPTRLAQVPREVARHCCGTVYWDAGVRPSWLLSDCALLRMECIQCVLTALWRQHTWL